MPKGTSWTEVLSNSEIIKPVALVVIELRFSGGISSARNSVKIFRCQNVWTKSPMTCH